MPFVALPRHRLHYRIDGQHGPWLMFCNSLGTDLHMWDAQASALSGQFRVLRYDRRGHGASGTPPAPYTLTDLGADAIALMDALSIEQTHYCGLSIGGLVAQWLALHHPRRITRVVACATASKIGTGQGWQTRMADVRAHGLQGMREATAERWFGERFRSGNAGQVDAVLDQFVATSVEGYVGCCAALADADLRVAISRNTVPLLAVSGDDDPVCPPSDLAAIAAAASGMHVSLPGRHLLNIESADALNDVLRRFLQ